jgi:thioredoxin-like negative regulator of GroEL
VKAEVVRKSVALGRAGSTPASGTKLNNMEKILRFTASWCQPCKQLAKTLESADLGVPIEVIDIDVNPEMVEEYQIRGVPTLVHLPSNQKISGAKTLQELQAWLQSCR